MMTTSDTQHSQKSNGVDPQLGRPGGLTYLEIPAADFNRSAAFYAAVLGWKTRGDAADMSRFSDPAGYLIGRFVRDRSASRPGLLPFIYINQIADAVNRVAQHGGEVVKPPYAEGNLLVAIVRDPAGNTIGLWEAA